MPAKFEKYSDDKNVATNEFGKQSPIRVAMFTDVFLDVPGGIPSSIMAQHDSLVAAGHTVKIFTPGFKSSIEKMPESIRDDIILVPTAKHLKPNEAPLAKWPKKIVKYVRKHYPTFAYDFDLVHIHYEAGASIAAVMLARGLGLPIVQTMHGREDMAIAVNVPHPFKTLAGKALNAIHKHYLSGYVGLLYSNGKDLYRGGVHKDFMTWSDYDGPLRADGINEVKTARDDYLAPTVARARMWDLMARQANCADVVITPSQHFADKLKKYGVKRAIRPVSNGVADAIVNLHDWKLRELKPGEPVKIAWYSRLSREKRVMEFLEALKIVHEKGGKFELLAMGDGNQLEMAKEYVAKNGFADAVKFLGAVPHDQVLEKIQDQHLSVINSYGFDTQGLTILEAAVTGLPVIYCDPDMDQIVLPGGGIRAADYSPEAMAESIMQILAKPEMIAKMSQAQFDGRDENLQSTQIKKLLEVYNSILDYKGN